MKKSPLLLLIVLLSVAAVSSGVGAAGPPTVIYPETTSLGIFEDEIFPFSVSVYDADDNPVPNPVVRWQGPTSGPRAILTPFSNGGEEDGLAWIGIQSAGGLGTYQITASIDGATPVTITITNYAQPLRVVSGGHQSAVINTSFNAPIVAQARTINGEPVAGVPISFSVAPGMATLSDALVMSGPDGFASVTVAAGSSSGKYDVTVSADSLEYAMPHTATLSNTSVPAQTISVINTPGELPIGGGTRELKARVFGSNGQPLRSAAVTFTSPATGPGIGRFAQYFEPPFLVPDGARSFTDFDGIAVMVVAANDQPGSYEMRASVEGVVNPARFALTNVPRQAATILPNGFPQDDFKGEQTSLGGRFDHIRLRVVDVDGGPIAGAIVTLTPPASGASMTVDQPILVSDADGWVETAGTANIVAGSYFLQADTPGVETTNMYLQNAPPGYMVGDQLADIAAADHTGTMRPLRSFTGNGNYLLIDVCAMWCTVCQGTQGFGQTMKADLAEMGIPISVVPVLIDSLTIREPSTQANATAWRTRYRIADPVLHASGDPNSQIRRVYEFLLGKQPGFPTFLLVSPDGTILDRYTGGFASPNQMTNFVLAAIPSDVSIAAATVNEGAAAAVVTVTRSNGSGAASVSYFTAPGSASSADFSATSGIVQFANGQLIATISVPIVNDAIDEPNETFVATLSNPVGTRIAQAQATITIIDNDAAPAISVPDARLSEGNAGNHVVMLPVRLDRPSAFSVTADYALIAGSAKSTDLSLTKGTVKFDPGKTESAIPLTLNGDKQSEGKETFKVRLSSVVNATLAATDTVVTIVDDDGDTTAPVIDAHADVIVEVKMSSTSSIVVDYKEPGAVDKNDGALAVSCAAASGVKRGYGSEDVKCTAEDKAGNLAVRTFKLIVRLPTVAGALFDPCDLATPLTEADRGDEVVVHVNAGAFVPRAKVTLTFIDARGRRHELGQGKARKDGSLDQEVNVPHGAALGIGQVLADSDAGNGEYDRAWLLEVDGKGRRHEQRHRDRRHGGN